jgi:hypothetical protein
MPDSPRDLTTPKRFRNAALLAGGVVLGIACFLAGRFSAPRNSSRTARTEKTVQSLAVAHEPRSRSIAPTPEPLPAAGSVASGEFETKWKELSVQPGSSARNRALEELVESLAATDPDRAISLARAEDNLKLRDELLQAALHGWARTAATNAADWALALTDSNEREHALISVFAGAVAANPEEAVRLGKNLFQKNPDDAPGYGSSLIGVLCDAGNFELAMRVAADGEGQTRSGWMGAAYAGWAEFQPEQAAQAATAIQDPVLRNEALHGIVGGWAEANPAALVQFVTQLPSDGERGALLSQSLERWVAHDPEAASAWINNRDPGPDLDAGVAAVASMYSVAPDTAAGWAESVSNPKLRSETLVTVIRNWLSKDLPAARNYFESTKNLLPSDRQELTDVFADFNKDAATQ